ncbi:uncharacterized protein LOC122717944 isoform X1 [Apis laboriosa]|uniref:uncharacterized protein LOC122717944 isoform X1 n=1 Tax=Apis laboriosa TaxID=183418 RepID=UPI001CC77B5F|nr:uncharacterized protein LOC122717944 isoform X1 [Apis laboriosa]
MKCDIKNCEDFLSIQGQNYLLWLMKTIGKVPVEILVDAVDCLISIARNQVLRDIIINTDIIEAMCASFELTCISMDDFKIACCKALSMMCLEEKGRQEFLKIEGPKRLYNLLCDIKSIPIRNAAAQLIQLLCADPVLANAFVSARFLNYMLNNRSTARIVPSWDTCIEALFDSHLPIKFAFTGRLSLHDITHDGFYVLRRNVCTFPILDDILRFKFCPLEPIYVVNCSEPEDCNQLNLEESKETISRGVFLSTEIAKLTLDTKFGTLQRDTCLYNYVELFKCKLIANESRNVVSKTTKGFININYVVSRAQMLAKFVSQQMSGPDPLITCVDHQLEIHLKEIKDTIETSVIPLGMLRVGSYFERALLFKVIADRIHLPAALVRGEYGKAWIEIAVPEVEDIGFL